MIISCIYTVTRYTSYIRISFSSWTSREFTCWTRSLTCRRHICWPVSSISSPTAMILCGKFSWELALQLLIGGKLNFQSVWIYQSISLYNIYLSLLLSLHLFLSLSSHSTALNAASKLVIFYLPISRFSKTCVVPSTGCIPMAIWSVVQHRWVWRKIVGTESEFLSLPLIIAFVCSLSLLALLLSAHCLSLTLPSSLSFLSALALSAFLTLCTLLTSSLSYISTSLLISLYLHLHSFSPSYKVYTYILEQCL